MITLKTEEGYLMKVLSTNEKTNLLKIITTDIIRFKSYDLPCGYSYRLISENDLDLDNIIVEIESKGIRKTIKGNVCNIENKISKEVIKING